METDKKRGKTGRLESLVAGVVLTSVLALSAGCAGSYAIGEESVKFKREQTATLLIVENIGKKFSDKPVRSMHEKLYVYYKKAYIDQGNDSIVDQYSITDEAGTTTYYASSPNPIDKKVIAIAQRQYDAYLSKISEMQTP